MQHPGEVKLIAVGWHPAKPAGEIREGDVLVYNYGSTAKVVKVEGVKGQFITFWTEAIRESDFYGVRACYKDRRQIDGLVGFDARASQKEAV
jgi:hypothetical protein